MLQCGLTIPLFDLATEKYVFASNFNGIKAPATATNFKVSAKAFS